MKINVEQIRQIDQIAIRDYGMPGLLLMENAGRGISDAISRQYPRCEVLVFSGKGNNGGDGLVVARYLVNRGYPVRVILLEDPARLADDPLTNFRILQAMKIPWDLFDNIPGREMPARCQASGLIVDAIFGIGIRGRVSGVFARAIDLINESTCPVVSADIPSGLDADTGEICGTAVRATMTVTLSLPKPGLFLGEGPRLAGRIEVVDIGIPRAVLAPFLNVP